MTREYSSSGFGETKCTAVHKSTCCCKTSADKPPGVIGAYDMVCLVPGQPQEGVNFL